MENTSIQKGTMEGTLFAIGSFSNPLAVTADDYEDYLNITFGSDLVANISAVYPISMFDSTASPALYAIAAVITDAEYACPTRRALKTSLTTHLGTYTYLWNHVPSCSWTPSIPTALLSYLGPTHTSELAFVFDETTNLPQPSGTCELSASEQILTIQIVTAWQSMSKNGYPSLANGSQWPDWSEGNQGAIFDGSLTFGIINMTQCDFWDTIQMVGSTNNTKNNTGLLTTSEPIPGIKGHGLLLRVSFFPKFYLENQGFFEEVFRYSSRRF
jgi:carboxylesterase type B